MPHTLTADFAFCHFNAAAIADFTLIADLLIFTAMAFPVLRRSENPFAEQTVTFGFQGSVVNGLRFLHFTV